MPVGLSAITARTAESFAGGILGVFDRTRVTEAPISNGAASVAWRGCSAASAPSSCRRSCRSRAVRAPSTISGLRSCWRFCGQDSAWTRREVGLAVGDGTSYLVALRLCGRDRRSRWLGRVGNARDRSHVFGAGEKVGQLGIARITACGTPSAATRDSRWRVADGSRWLAAAALLWVWIKPATSRSVTN